MAKRRKQQDGRRQGGAAASGKEAKPPEYVQPYPCNHVCTAYIRRIHGKGSYKFDIEAITYLTMGRYGRDVFPCCTIRMRNPKVTVAIFDTGRVVVSGAVLKEAVHLALWQLAHRLGVAFGQAFCVRDFVVQNVIMSGSLGMTIDPKALDADFKPKVRLIEEVDEKTGKLVRTERRDMSSWVPQKFQAVRIFISMMKPVIIMFSTGRYVLTGAKEQEVLVRELNRIDWKQYATE